MQEIYGMDALQGSKYLRMSADSIHRLRDAKEVYSLPNNWLVKDTARRCSEILKYYEFRDLYYVRNYVVGICVWRPFARRDSTEVAVYVATSSDLQSKQFIYWITATTENTEKPIIFKGAPLWQKIILALRLIKSLKKGRSLPDVEYATEEAQQWAEQSADISDRTMQRVEEITRDLQIRQQALRETERELTLT